MWQIKLFNQSIVFLQKRVEQSGCHFADSIFKDIPTDENISFAIHISHITYILYRAECISYLAIRLVS